MIFEISSNNPLKEILDTIPRKLSTLTIGMLGKIRLLLISGGIRTESSEELVGFLEILKEMGLIDLVKQSDNTIKVRNKYNG